MATDFELALFAQQLEEVLELPEARRWSLERDESVPLQIFVVMHSVSDPKEFYKARLRWRDLMKPPSLKFIDMTSDADNNPAAWPKCFGFRPGSLDACLPWTEEGHGLHPEWANSAANAFPKVAAPVQFALLHLQSSLDNSYQGRGP
ncbi:hypothetical protein [Piscinibacter sp.]|jgi:hypothetical protein|uniref:hypothetical protein n=1 Tax=Piscinibacter sp. TaxID=1903157 RepID=UPI001B7C3357|nr:hypothetical protein [Piscinibacter sp.]MBK7532282.1 hypothetical protein [Piscinibacter sp.]MBP6542468.1 hypothetical protein [Piscinibacter sp.]HOX68980.1 hypothetical protein [Burkholderiaceae bacterium]